MDRLIKITKTGLIQRRWNSDRRETHRLKKNGDTWSVVSKESGETVKIGPSRDEAEEFFYDEAPPGNIIACLRDFCVIEEGVTIQDIVDTVNNSGTLHSFADACLPGFHGQVNLPNHLRLPAGEDDIVLSRTGNLHDDRLTLIYATSIGTPCPIPDAAISLDENFKIHNSECEVVFEGKYSWCLIDVLNALFGLDADLLDTYTITKTGLKNHQGMSVDEPARMLMHWCEVDEDVTLGDIFRMVGDDDFLKSFIALYSWCGPIDEFHQAALEDPKPSEDLWYLRVHRIVDIHTYKGETTFALSHDFGGVGELCEDEKEYYDKHPDKPRATKTHYSVSYSPMNTLAHLPVFLESMVDVQEFNRGRREYDEYFKGFFPFTLLDFLDAIYWDISFVGGPEDNAAFMEDMSERVAEAKEGLAEGKRYNSVVDMLKDMAGDEDDDGVRETHEEIIRDMEEKDENSDGDESGRE